MYVNPLLIIVGIAAFVYGPTILGLLKLEYRIVSVIPTKIEANKLTLNAGMELYNRSGFRLTINQIIADVYLNGVQIGTITNTLNTPIPAGRKQVIGLGIEITPDVVGNTVWAMAINQNLQNFVIELRGTITANDKKMPLSAQWTIKDFVNGIGAVTKIAPKLFNHALHNELVKKYLKKELKDYGITEIFVIDGELHTTSYYDIPKKVISEIEDYCIVSNYVP